MRRWAFVLIFCTHAVLRQYAAKPHPNIVLVNDVCCSELASIARVFKLVVDAPIMLQTLCPASIPHASHITCIAAL